MLHTKFGTYFKAVICSEREKIMKGTNCNTRFVSMPGMNNLMTVFSNTLTIQLKIISEEYIDNLFSSWFLLLMWIRVIFSARHRTFCIVFIKYTIILYVYIYLFLVIFVINEPSALFCITYMFVSFDSPSGKYCGILEYFYIHCAIIPKEH